MCRCSERVEEGICKVQQGSEEGQRHNGERCSVHKGLLKGPDLMKAHFMSRQMKSCWQAVNDSVDARGQRMRLAFVGRVPFVCWFGLNASQSTLALCGTTLSKQDNL